MLQQIKNEECVSKACMQNEYGWGIAKAWGDHDRISETEKKTGGKPLWTKGIEYPQPMGQLEKINNYQMNKD